MKHQRDRLLSILKALQFSLMQERDRDGLIENEMPIPAAIDLKSELILRKKKLHPHTLVYTDITRDGIVKRRPAKFEENLSDLQKHVIGPDSPEVEEKIGFLKEEKYHRLFTQLLPDSQKEKVREAMYCKQVASHESTKTWWQRTLGSCFEVGPSWVDLPS